MNVGPIWGDIGGAGTAPVNTNSGTAVETGPEAQAFLEIVRQHGPAAQANGTKALGAFGTQEPRGVAQELLVLRKKQARRRESDESPATNGVAGGTPFSPVVAAAERLTSVAERPWNLTGTEGGTGRPRTEAFQARRGQVQEARPPTKDSGPTVATAPIQASNPPDAAPSNSPQVTAIAGARSSSPSQAGRGPVIAANSVASPHSGSNGSTPTAAALQTRSQSAPSSALRALWAPGAVAGGARNSGGAARGVQLSRQPAITEQPVEAQVARGLAQVLRQRGGSVTLRLAPDALGEVRVQLKIEGTDVAATMHASSEGARETLAKAADSLRASLESHGLRVTELRVIGPEPGQVQSPSPSLSDTAGTTVGDSRAGNEGAQGRKEASEGATSSGAPCAEEDYLDPANADFGWAVVGGRLVIDTVA